MTSVLPIIFIANTRVCWAWHDSGRDHLFAIQLLPKLNEVVSMQKSDVPPQIYCPLGAWDPRCNLTKKLFRNLGKG